MPGWTRLDVAERELQKLDTPAPAGQAVELNREFQSYLARADSKRDVQRTPQSRDAMFAEFLQWREQQEARSARNESTKEVTPQQPARTKRSKK